MRRSRAHEHGPSLTHGGAVKGDCNEPGHSQGRLLTHLSESFSVGLGADLTPWGHLAMSGAVFGAHGQGEGPGISGWGCGMLPSSYHAQDSPPQRILCSKMSITVMSVF